MFVPGTEKLLFPPFELQDPSSMLSRGIIQNITYSSSSFLNDPFALCASCISCRTRVSPAPLYKGHASLNRDTRRASSSASSQRWQSRQGKDRFSREARVQGLKSRAAFKLLEVRIACDGEVFELRSDGIVPQINERYKILKRGQTVVDLVWVLSGRGRCCSYDGLTMVSGLRSRFLVAGNTSTPTLP